MDSSAHHLLINGLSVGTGGGYTVARELLRHIALARPQWRVTIALCEAHPLQQSMGAESLPDNCEFCWAPPEAAHRIGRQRYEREGLVRWAEGEDVDAVFQPNAMLIPEMRRPTFCHAQDPWPYRPEAWESLRDRMLAFFKRRRLKESFRKASVYGWTSNYLRELTCRHHGFAPDRGEVFYNGVAEEWLERARQPLPSWDDRPLEIATVSNVHKYKRQSLIMEALPRLHDVPELKDLTYRIVGGCDPAYEDELNRFARDLGVGSHVVIEGRVSDERVQEVLRTARAMPLMSVCESFGIPTIEAMSYGTPVVIADCCALPEVCGDAALACPMDDLDALVARLREVLTNSELAAQLRRAGAERMQRFSWSETAEKMAPYLDELVAAE